MIEWHEAVAELLLALTQLLKSYAPNGCHISLACPPVETNTIEFSNAFGCHVTWLSFMEQPAVVALSRQPAVVALSRNPPPELGFGSRVLLWHVAVTELYREFTQLFELIVPNGC